MNAIDTNVLVYAFDDEQVEKRGKAVELIDRLTDDPQSTILLWQVGCEFIAVLRRWQSQGRVSASDVETYCQEVLGYFQLVCPVPEIIPLALRLASQHSLSHWDSLLIAAALEAGVKCLYTEELGAGERYESLTVVNPFG